MIFEWDEPKRAANLAKHGVDFETVWRFDMSSAVRSLDRRMDFGEARWRATGFIRARLHVLVFTWRDENIRVISLRKANAKERKAYETESRR